MDLNFTKICAKQLFFVFPFRQYNWTPAAVASIIKVLQEKGVVKAMDHGAFTRVAHQDTQIQVRKFSSINIHVISFFFCYLHVNTKIDIFEWRIQLITRILKTYRSPITHSIYLGRKTNANDGEFEATDHSNNNGSILWKTCGWFDDREQGDFRALHNCW